MIDKNKISPLQFMFSVTCFIQSSTLLSSIFVTKTLKDSWSIVVASALLTVPLILMLYGIMKAFPNKNLIQVNDIVFGKVLGKVFSVLYIFYFLSLSALNTRDLGVFIKENVLSKTPPVLILILFILLCNWAVKQGIDVVTRYNPLFALIDCFVIIFATMLISGLIDLNNLVPMFERKFLDYVQGTHIATTIPFGELVVFLMITPNIKGPVKKIKKYFLIGFLIGAISYLIIVTRDTAVLGNAARLFNMPPFEAFKLISIGTAISRVEILFALVAVFLLFAKICFLYYITVTAIAQIFDFGSIKALTATVGILIIVYAFTVYSSPFAHRERAASITPFVWTLFEILMPLITLIMIKIRKFDRPKLRKRKLAQ